MAGMSKLFFIYQANYIIFLFGLFASSINDNVQKNSKTTYLLVLPYFVSSHNYIFQKGNLTIKL